MLQLSETKTSVIVRLETDFSWVGPNIFTCRNCDECKFTFYANLERNKKKKVKYVTLDQTWKMSEILPEQDC